MAWFDQLPVGWKIGSALLGLILLGFVLAVFYFGLRRILEWRNLQDLKVEDRVRLRIEIIKTSASILGGTFFLLTLFFTWQNLRLTEEKNRADLLMDQERHRTDLFVKATKQLGDGRLEVRLGGIYALERIARDSEKDHWPIMEVLTAYVRENAPWPPDDRSEARKKLPWVKIKDQETPSQEKEKGKEEKKIQIKPDTDIQAILTVLGRRQRKHENPEKQFLDLSRTDLRGAGLIAAHLEKAILYQAHLEGADLYQAHLEKANLWKSHLEKAIFSKARLEGANLREAHLERADLSWANLEGAILEKARHLKRAVLEKTNLEEANLRLANLEGAILTWAYLEGANLNGTDFRKAINLEKNQVIQAKCWPLAFFDANLLEALGLPPDHNERLKKRDLSSYNLEGANLRRAELYKFNLQQANLKGAHLERAGLQYAKLKGADLKNAHLEGARLKSADFRKVKNLKRDQVVQAKSWLTAFFDTSLLEELGLPLDHNERLKKKDLSGYTLEGFDLRGTFLYAINLKHANLKGTRLDGSFLWGVRLDGADLRRANLEGVKFRGVNLKGANLKEAHLEGADFFVTNLEGADLRNAHLEGADLRGAKGLKEEQIRQAIIDEKTKLPDDLKHLEKSAKSKPEKQ
jgi:uncharacterized protein YjbI with pentapeptide repeats